MADLSPTEVVRLLISDTNTGDAQLFTDDQIGAFLGLYAGNVHRAAAKALRTIAASEVLVSKKIRTQDLSTDGPAVAAALRALADDCLAEADAADAAEGAFFEIVPFASSFKPEGAEYRYP